MNTQLEDENDTDPFEDDVLLQEVIRAVVDYPEQVFVDVNLDKTGEFTRKILSVRTNPSDCGKVIGRDGRMVDALRVIFSAIGTRNRCPIFIKVIDKDGTHRQHDFQNNFRPGPPRAQTPFRPR